MFLVPLRALGSSACRRVRRVVAPAGESLSFVASNESNQSKDALHMGVTLRLQGFGRSTPCFGQAAHMLRFLRHLPRFASARSVDGKVCAANDRIALGPRGRRRGAQGFGAARASALRPLTSRRLFERSERSEHSEFGARPQSASTAEQSALGRPPPSGRLFFGDFLLAKQKKVTALSGAHPDAASRSEQETRESGTGLRYLSLSGRRCTAAGKARDPRTAGFDTLSPNGQQGTNK
jgi:hypothetical protein